MHRASLLALVLVGGCSRELVPLSTKSPEPAFLGELAGVYVGAISLEQGEQVDLQEAIYRDEEARRAVGVPVPSDAPTVDEVVRTSPYAPVQEVVYVAHLVDGKEPATMISVLMRPDALSNPDRPSEPFVNGPVLGGVIEAGGGIVLGEEERSDLLMGARLPGGAGFVVDDFYRVCRDGARHRLNAARACEFNPALSGLYEATVSDCDGGNGQSTHFGLGFVEGAVVGVRYPDVTSLMLGFFDRFTSSGQSFVFDNLDKQVHPSFFTLDDDGSQLSYSEEVYHYIDGTCRERRFATRLAGGEHRGCTVPDPSRYSPALYVSYAGLLRRDLFVVLVTPEGQRLDVHDFGSVTILRSIETGEVVEADAPPAYDPATTLPYTARYSNVPFGDYELWGADLDGRASTDIARGLGIRMAIPMCLNVPGTN